MASRAQRRSSRSSHAWTHGGPGPWARPLQVVPCPGTREAAAQLASPSNGVATCACTSDRMPQLLLAALSYSALRAASPPLAESFLPFTALAPGPAALLPTPAPPLLAVPDAFPEVVAAVGGGGPAETLAEFPAGFKLFPAGFKFAEFPTGLKFAEFATGISVLASGGITACNSEATVVFTFALMSLSSPAS